MTNTPILLNPRTWRRFVLGRQGLYPGRRWQGKAGAAEALRAVEAVQIDPLNITARSHDLTMHSRVLDYEVTHLDQIAHQDRRAFDYGNLLFYYPIEDLPYFRPIMRSIIEHPGWKRWMHEHLGDDPAELLTFVRAELDRRGPLGNRDFAGNAKVESYRARKDSGIALYHLWMTGELMTHSRNRFERRLHFMDQLVPAAYQGEASFDQARAYFARKALAFMGIGTQSHWEQRIYAMTQVRDPGMKAHIRTLLDSGAVIPVQIEGEKQKYYLLADDLPALHTVADGGIPAAWQHAGVSSTDEVTFLAPLDIVSTRGRAGKLFNFEYIWEVYKPAHLRRWGYYCLPILYGDTLVGRLDPKMDRKANRLDINAFYLEDTFTPDDAFADALGKGVARFVRFNGASSVNLAAINPDWLRTRVESHLP